MTFLKKIFEVTKTSAEPKAQASPVTLLADMSNEQANMTPRVKGSSEKYVFPEYETPKSRA
jgi:hypothetical protein